MKAIRKREVRVYKTSITRHLLLKCLYQARKMSGDVFVLDVSVFGSFYDFSILFWSCYDSVVFVVFIVSIS